MNTNTPDEFERLLQGLKRPEGGQPKRDLMPGILARIEPPEAAVIPMKQWYGLLAAAVILIILNVTGLLYYSNLSSQSDQTYALVSNYFLY